jgi:hypothetical protein
MHEEFPSVRFKSWRDLYEFAEEATQNYGVIVIDNSSNCQFLTYRAPANLPAFTIKQKR